MLNVVHVTHEAVYKVGGIGTVLEGLINALPYQEEVDRTVLVCPLFYPENTNRLGRGGLVEYSSLDGNYGSPYADAFRYIEARHNVSIVYGRRPLEDDGTGRRTVVEVLLVDIRRMNRERINEVKARLWESCGLESSRYEHIWEFEQYVELAWPAAEALAAMQVGIAGRPAAVFAHEFMGVPTALALQHFYPGEYRSVFHAHEVAPIRRIVEGLPGHDVMFYNVLERAMEKGRYVADVFGPQDDYHKTAVVEAAAYCDEMLAVGHHVVNELRFLNRHLAQKDIQLAFNGIPSRKISHPERKASTRRLRKYCQNLLGWEPDYVFTHVTRLAPSKALWRDIDVLMELDGLLGEQGKTAVELVLSTELPRRPAQDIHEMEDEYGWPLAHREGNKDLTGGEAKFYARVQAFNARARNIRVIFINQFGFDRACCGKNVPSDIEFLDIRRGSDVEFGVSLYEPFGISPLEPLTYGALCVVSTSCGCAGFVEEVAQGEETPNVIFADYIHGGKSLKTLKDAVSIGAEKRRAAELAVAKELAQKIVERLPKDAEEEKARIRAGYRLAAEMSWDAVAERVIMPTLLQLCAPPTADLKQTSE